MLRSSFVLALVASCATTQPHEASITPVSHAPPTAAAPEPTPPCGEPGSTTPPAAIAELTLTSGNSCARLVDDSVWCWGPRGTKRIDGCVFGSLACPIATRVPATSPAPEPAPAPSFFGGTCTLARGELTCRFGEQRRVVATEIAWFVPTHAWLLAIRNDGVPLRIGACDGKVCELPLAPEVSDAVAIVHGDPQTCILTRDGHVWCERPCTAHGCVRDFVAIAGVDQATQLAVAPDHACVIRSDGTVVCWGESSCGQAGGASRGGNACTGKRIVGPSSIVWAK